MYACALRALGRFEESRAKFVECIRICEAVFKPTHPNLIPNLINYGKLLVLEKNWEKAEEIFKRALGIHKGAGRTGGAEVEMESFLEQVRSWE